MKKRTVSREAKERNVLCYHGSGRSDLIHRGATWVCNRLGPAHPVCRKHRHRAFCCVPMTASDARYFMNRRHVAFIWSDLAARWIREPDAKRLPPAPKKRREKPLPLYQPPPLKYREGNWYDGDDGVPFRLFDGPSRPSGSGAYYPERRVLKEVKPKPRYVKVLDEGDAK